MARSTGQTGSRVAEGDAAVEGEIIRGVVAIYTEFYGRGPTEAKVRRRAELVVCLFEDVFGRPERILVEAGHFEQVRLNRQVVREQIEPRLRAVVEAATGAAVEVCIGQITESGLACEVFILDSAAIAAGPEDPALPRSAHRG